MKDYINDTFDDIEADIYAVLGRINALRMDIDGGQSIPAVKREWVSLTDEELRNAYCEVSGNEWCIGGISNAETFYDAIEAKLKEKNNG